MARGVGAAGDRVGWGVLRVAPVAGPGSFTAEEVAPSSRDGSEPSDHAGVDHLGSPLGDRWGRVAVKRRRATYASLML